MHLRLIVPLLCLLLLSLPPCAVAGDTLPAAAWDQTLDRIQAWTWGSRTDLIERLEKEEARTGQSLTAYISAWEPRLTARAPSAATGGADSPAPLKEEVYRRLVAARTVQYLRSGDQKSLTEAIQLSGRFSGNLIQTDTAFWYFYPRALADIQAGNADALLQDAFSLLNTVVLWGEPPFSGRMSRQDLEQSHYALNLADLIINRAIIQQKLSGLEPLGVIVWLLNSRSGAPGSAPGDAELQRLINGVRQHLTGPESDSLRLNYAVAMYEAGRQRRLLFREINAQGNSTAVLEHFTAAREALYLAYTWAGSVQGRVTAASGLLELENLALERMYAYLPPGVTASLANTPGRITPDMAEALYGELAAGEKDQGSWERLGFSDRKAYIQGARRLWSVLQRHALLVAELMLQRINRDDFRSISEHSVAVEKPLLGYIRLFRTYTADGQREIVPDSAYFAYAESMKLLGRLKGFDLVYDGSLENYRQTVGYLLQGAAVYPYDQSIADYASTARKINTGDLNLLPDRVTAGIVANEVVGGCLQGDDSICPVGARESLRWNIYKVHNRLNATQGESRQAEISALLTAWRESLPAGRNPSDNQSAEESRMISHGRRFRKEARLLAERIAAAEKEAQRCRGQWQACAPGRPPVAGLLAERSSLEKMKNGLLLEADRFNNIRTKAGRKASMYSSNLALMAEDEFVQISDRIFAMDSSRLKSELAGSDDHPMHKSIRNGFYRIRQPGSY